MDQAKPKRYLRYLVLSDREHDRHFKNYTGAMTEFNRRLQNACSGIQLWREFKTYDLLLYNGDRGVKEDMRKSNIRQVYEQRVKKWKKRAKKIIEAKAHATHSS